MIKTLNIWLFKNETLLKTNACHSHRFKIAFFSYVEERGMQIEQDFMYAFYFSARTASLDDMAYLFCNLESI